MKKLLLLLISVFSIKAMELDVVSSQPVRVLEHRNNMYVEDENAAYRVEKHNMNKELRDVLAHKALKKFKEAGYIRVTKDSENKYNLAAKIRGEGGTGPITAGIVGFAVRFGCYTGYLLGASTTVVAGTAIAGPAGAAAAGTAVTTALAGAGGAAGVIAATETLAMKATLGTLLLPIPLP